MLELWDLLPFNYVMVTMFVEQLSYGLYNHTRNKHQNLRVSHHRTLIPMQDL